jgi:hypothetical protein
MRTVSLVPPTTWSAGASNISRRAGPPVRYSPRELDEGPAFIKALIELERGLFKPAVLHTEQVELLHKSKLGTRNTELRC